MKKFILNSLALSTMIIGLSACQELADENPVYVGHDGQIYEAFLNPPAMQTQYITLSEDIKNGTLHLTGRQPDFGYNAIATYRVQVSLNPEFSSTAFPEGNWIEIQQDFYNLGEINPRNHNIASALERLSGVEDESEEEMGKVAKYQTLYVRLRAFISQTPENSQFISNVVQFDHVNATYYAVWKVGVPSGIYLRGGMNDWGAPDDYEFYQDVDENTYIMTLPAKLEKGVEFKVADASWGPINYGASSGSVAIGEAKKLEYDKGNLNLTEDYEGDVHLTVSEGSYYLLFKND